MSMRLQPGTRGRRGLPACPSRVRGPCAQGGSQLKACAQAGLPLPSPRGPKQPYPHPFSVPLPLGVCVLLWTVASQRAKLGVPGRLPYSAAFRKWGGGSTTGFIVLILQASAKFEAGRLKAYAQAGLPGWT